MDEDLVRSLLRAQHPDLANLPLQLCDAGWDNVMWRLGEELAVRMPRRQVAAPLIEHEQRWLPELAARLPLPVPVPVRKGRPSGGYPFYWSVVPWIDGRPGDREPVTDSRTTGKRLGAFLAAMHRTAPADAPYNPYRSGPVASRTDTFEERLAKLTGHVDPVALRRIWDRAVSAPLHDAPAVWAHGDLHPANTLVRDGAVVAVIDFGDLCAADPAVDLGAALMSLDGDGTDQLWVAYGGRTASLECRAEGWAVLFSLMLLEIGLEGRPSYADVGRRTLHRLTERDRSDRVRR